MASPLTASAAKFDLERAAEYEKQSRIALAGYDACHELSACMLAAALGAGTTASILVVGVGGTAQEIMTAGRLEPNWRFTAVDPSQPMLDLAVQRLTAAGLAERTDARLGYVEDLPADAPFDAATLIGVLHHLPGTEAKARILRSIMVRLKPGAPLILACNQYAYASQPLLLSAWGQRWRMHGASAAEVKAKLGKILQGADPPESEAAVISLLDGAGFGQPTRFFGSLFWGAWLARRNVESGTSVNAPGRAPGRSAGRRW
jgi:tRNA (cmo5U34)-methyltransferase